MGKISTWVFLTSERFIFPHVVVVNQAVNEILIDNFERVDNLI